MVTVTVTVTVTVKVTVITVTVIAVTVAVTFTSFPMQTTFAIMYNVYQHALRVSVKGQGL